MRCKRGTPVRQTQQISNKAASIHSCAHVEQGRRLSCNFPSPFSTFLKGRLWWLRNRGWRSWLWRKAWNRCPYWWDHSRGSGCSSTRLGKWNALAHRVHGLWRIKATWKQEQKAGMLCICTDNYTVQAIAFDFTINTKTILQRDLSIYRKAGWFLN